MVLITCFFLLGHGAFTGTTDIEEIITSVGAILRLLDDLDATQVKLTACNYYCHHQPGCTVSVVSDMDFHE